MSKTKKKQLTNEGLFDYIGKILKKTNNKRFIRTLNKIEKSGPQGKKAVQDYRDRVERLTVDTDRIEKLSASFGL